MAKTTTLKERGTGAVLYPQTIPSQVIFPDGTDLNDALESQSNVTGVPTEKRIEAIEPTLVTEALRKVPQSLTPEEQVQVKENLGISKKELFIDMWRAAAGTWGKIDYSHFENGVSKPYYLNELWLTYEEAVAVMDWGAITTYSTLARYKGAKIRTNLPPRVGATSDANTTTAFDLKYFDQGSDIEILNLACGSQAGNMGFVVAPQGNGSDFGLSGSKLRKVLGIVNLGKITSFWTYLIWTPKLEEIRISHLKVSITFAKCPLISAASIRYLIGERSGTNAITVTLHADTYAKLTSAVDDPEDEWYGLIDLAAAKQITFACA